MAHERAGTPALPEDLVDIGALEDAYYTTVPDPKDPLQQVVFGTSGHRGSSLDAAFTESHIVATTAAIIEYRRGAGIDGPLFIGFDTHALSRPAWRTAIEVLVGADIEVCIDELSRHTPTPAVSHAILVHNRAGGPEADGIVVTPSHNPPRDGGFKYNPPNGGPADSSITSGIADRANELLRAGLASIPRVPFERAIASDRVIR